MNNQDSDTPQVLYNDRDLEEDDVPQVLYNDKKRKKGPGFLGKLQRPDGDFSTELSIGVNVDGEEMEIPTLVPSLSKEEVDYLLNGNEPTKEIVDKAVKHAKERKNQGLGPFVEDTKDDTPKVLYNEGDDVPKVLYSDKKPGDLFLKKDYKPPGPSKAKAPSQLLKVIPREKHKEALKEIMSLQKEDKLFSEEGVKRMAKFAGKEEANRILVEGDQGQPYGRDLSLMQAIKEGGQESVSGLLTGYGPDYDEMQKRAMGELPMIKKVAKGLVKIGGDAPAILTGLGIGAVESLPFGGPTTPWGAAMMTANAFAVPGLIHDAYEEAQRLVNDNPKLKGKTLEQLSALANDPEALKKMGLGFIKSSALGALVAVNPILKGLQATPLAELLEKPILGSAVALGTEATTLTLAPAMMEGKTPTWSDFIENAALIGTIHLTTGAAKKLASWAKRENLSNQGVIEKNIKLNMEEAKKLHEARTMEEVDKIISDSELRSEGGVEGETKEGVAEKEPTVKKEKPSEAIASEAIPNKRNDININGDVVSVNDKKIELKENENKILENIIKEKEKLIKEDKVYSYKHKVLENELKKLVFERLSGSFKYDYNRGDIIPHKDIPNEVYHVTTNNRDINKSGIIKIGGKDKGGLGGVHKVVSFTADKYIAEQIKKDIIFANEFSDEIKKVDTGKTSYGLSFYNLRTIEGTKKAIELLKKQAIKEGFEFEPIQEKMSPYELIKNYFTLREHEIGLSNPILLNEINVDPKNVSIISVKKSSLPKEGGKAGDKHLKEISFDRDIPIEKPVEKPAEVLAAKEPKPKKAPEESTPMKRMKDLTPDEMSEYASLKRELKDVQEEINSLIKDKNNQKSLAESEAKKQEVERYYQNLITDSVQRENSIARRMNDIARPEPRVLSPEEITNEKQRLKSNIKDLQEQDEILNEKRRGLQSKLKEAIENKDKKAKRRIGKRIGEINRKQSEISKNIGNMFNELRNVGLKPERGVRYGTEQPEQVRLAPIRGKGEKVTPRHEIISMFREVFKDTPIRIGKLPRSKKGMTISGIFKRDMSVIRIDNAVNVETAAHEIGHKLHDMLYGGDKNLPLKERLQNVNKALSQWSDEFNAIGRYSPLAVEGHAEFVRMYVTNPKEAKRLAPRYYEHFEKTLEKVSPQALEVLQRTRDAYKLYLEGSSYAREKAGIVSLRNRSVKKRVSNWYNRNINFDRFMTNWIDRMHIFKKAFAEMTGIKVRDVENIEHPLNIYHSFRGLAGWVEKADLFYREETFNPVTFKKTGEGLIKRFENLMPKMTPLEMDEFSVYVKQKRGLDLEKKGTKSGSELVDLDKNYKDLHGKYDALALEYDDWLWQGQLYLVARGLRSMEQIQAMRKVNPFYVPFYRFFEDWEARSKKTGGETGSLQAKFGFHRIFGSERAILDPIESGIQNIYHLIQMAEKNASGQKLVKLAQTSPAGGKFIEKVSKEKRLVYEIEKKEMLEAIKKEALRKDPSGNSDEIASRMAAEILPESFEIWRPKAFGPEENVITVYFDGKPEYFETIPEIAELYKNNSPYMSGLLFKVGVKAASILRTGAILNVPFQAANFIRDYIGGLLFTKHPGIVRNFIYPFKAILHAVNKSELYKDWIKAGGGMSTKQNITRNMEHIQKINAKILAKKALPTEWIRWAGNILEESNRIAEYMKGVEDLGVEPWQKSISAFRARDISIDFAKAGLKGKALNQVITFWNATVQGLNKLGRTVKNPVDLRNFMMGATQNIIIPQLIFSYINKDDDQINDLPDYILDSYFVFRVGDRIERIPLPHEPGLLINGMTRRLFNYIIKKDPRAFDGFFGNIMQMGLPSAVPQALNLLHQIGANKDTFRNRDIVPPSKTGLVSEMQYNEFTSPSAYQLAKLISYLPGVDAYRSKATSPMIVDFFLKAFAGGLGKSILSLTDRIIRASGNEPFIVKPKESILQELGLDPFTVRHPDISTESVQKFYDTYGLYKKLEKSYKLALDRGKTSIAERLFKDMNKMAPGNMHKMAENMETIQAMINNLYKSKLPDNEKQAFLDSLYMKKAEFARNIMKEIYKHQDKSK